MISCLFSLASAACADITYALLGDQITVAVPDDLTFVDQTETVIVFHGPTIAEVFASRPAQLAQLNAQAEILDASDSIGSDPQTTLTRNPAIIVRILIQPLDPAETIDETLHRLLSTFSCDQSLVAFDDSPPQITCGRNEMMDAGMAETFRFQVTQTQLITTLIRDATDAMSRLASIPLDQFATGDIDAIGAAWTAVWPNDQTNFAQIDLLQTDLLNRIVITPSE